MHSRIFQVSMEPFDECDYIEESNYYDHWFTNSIADYVSDSFSRSEDLKWLEDCYDTKGIEFGVDDNGEYLVIKSKQKYFKDNFEGFIDILNKIKERTLDDFMYGIPELYTLNALHEDKYGFYIDANGELMTLDSFIRLCTTEEKYYIGGTIDYHY